MLKKSLQRRLADIEHERKVAHYELPALSDAFWDGLRTEAHVEYFPRPLGSFMFKPTHYKGPLFKSKIQIGNTEARYVKQF